VKILAGVDDSANSRAALDFIRRAAWPAGTEVIVLSVAVPQVAAYSMMDAGAASYLKEIQETLVHRHREIASRAEHELRQAGLAVRAQVARGDPRDVLVRTAEAERADLLVVGSHGRSGLAKLLMGSVANHVVTHAPCSVLVVKIPPAQEPARESGGERS
jgi:nucleotide-binding universal stress UspA family protein